MALAVSADYRSVLKTDQEFMFLHKKQSRAKNFHHPSAPTTFFQLDWRLADIITHL